MFHHLLYPKTMQGKTLHFILVVYLSAAIVGCGAPPQPTVKPPTAIARAMETRTFQNDMKIVLKAAINALQDMDYTIDVLNSDVGLITASRTTEQQKSELANDEEEPTGLRNFEKVCIAASCIFIFAIILANIFDGDDKKNSDHDRNNSGNAINYGGGDNDDGPIGPRVYRYKVTVNLNDADSEKTKVRVSASGEIEQDGKILSTGGVHEPEFFQHFFANMNKALFLEDQGK